MAVQICYRHTILQKIKTDPLLLFDTSDYLGPPCFQFVIMPSAGLLSSHWHPTAEPPGEISTFNTPKTRVILWVGCVEVGLEVRKHQTLKGAWDPGRSSSAWGHRGRSELCGGVGVVKGQASITAAQAPLHVWARSPLLGHQTGTVCGQPLSKLPLFFTSWWRNNQHNCF